MWLNLNYTNTNGKLAKDDDEDLREELDAEFQDIHALLRGMGSKPERVAPLAFAGMNPERAALLSVTDKMKFDKEFDIAAKKMAQEPRSKPSERIREGEELEKYDAERLMKAQRKARALPENSDEEDAGHEGLADDDEEEEDFGFGSGMQAQKATEIGVEDEDEFLIDDDLVSNGSQADLL